MKYIPKDGILFKIPPRLGDTVLMEPILRSFLSHGILAGVDSPYAAIFDSQHWASVGPNPLQFDMECFGEPVNRVQQYHTRLCNAGYDIELITMLPRIDNIQPTMGPGERMRIGIIHGVKDALRQWPFFKLLVRALSSRTEVISFDKIIPLGYGKSLTQLTLKELLGWLKSMDIVVSNDTGPAHVAAALGIPTLVLVASHLQANLYIPYGEIVKVIVAPRERLDSLSVRRVLTEVHKYLAAKHVDLTSPGDVRSRIVVSKCKKVALMRLDGLGGTITLLDQATKVHRITGKSVELITRGFEPLLCSHPAVKQVRNIGGVDWFEALELLRDSYHALADIRLAVGKWYGSPPIKSNHDLDPYYYNFPLQMVELESYGLHQVQLADKSLGLPSDTIEIDICVDAPLRFNLPRPYLLLVPGTDVIHKGARQTKQWNGWNLLNIVNMVQIGNRYDAIIPNAIDLRDKTTLLDLVALIRNAHIILCVEGGVAHLAYALKHPRTLVIRGPTRGKLFEYPGLHYIDSYVCSPCWSTKPDWVWLCPQKVDSVCMDSIKTDRVLYHIENLL